MCVELMAEPLLKKTMAALAAALPFSLTLLLFAPLNIYLANSREFNFSLADLLLTSLYLTAAATLLLAPAMMFLAPKCREKALSLLTALTLLLWIQGNLLVWNYGIFDGRDIPWGEKTAWGIADGAVWAAVLILAFAKSSAIGRAAKKIGWALILVQAISTAGLYMIAPSLKGYTYLSVDRSHQSEFSGDKNVLVIALDSFQTDVFQELLHREPLVNDMFPGFIYYPDCLGGYDSTNLSVPYILTGRLFEQIRNDTFSLKAYDRSLPARLRQHGFHNEVYPLMSHLLPDRPDIFANVMRKKKSNPAEMALLYDIALFRTLPHFVKRIVYNDQLWLLKRAFPDNEQRIDRQERRRLFAKLKQTQRNDQFLFDQRLSADMLTQTNLNSRQPTFKYFHLWAIHHPFRMGPDCSYRMMGSTRESALIQARCTLRQAQHFITALQRLGIFERTLIFIIGDHGLGIRGLDLRADLFPGATADDNNDPLLARIKASAMPLFLVKPLRQTAAFPMRVSYAPITLGDIPQTVLADLGISAEGPGRSVFSFADSAPRQRRFLLLGNYTDPWGRALPRSEYIVSGPAWLNKSWRLTPAAAR